MGNLEVFTMNENGAGWVPLSTLPVSERIALEVETDLASVGMSARPQLLCYTCSKPIASGMGSSFCSTVCRDRERLTRCRK